MDVLPMRLVAGVLVLRGDIADADTPARIMDSLKSAAADLVLSDMAPNLTGVAPIDEARSQALVMQALDLARGALKPGGCFLVKVFHGSGLDAVMREMKQGFSQVHIRKPDSSRDRSTEVYLLETQSG